MTDLNQTMSEIQFPLEDLNAISKQIKGAANVAAEASWSDAAATFSFSVGPAGGNLQGWITYYDGKKIHFQLDKISQKTGTAAGAGAIAYIRVRDFKEVGTHGHFKIHGFMLSGSYLQLSFGDQDLTNPKEMFGTSAAPWDFKMSGTVNYEKVSND